MWESQGENQAQTRGDKGVQGRLSRSGTQMTKQKILGMKSDEAKWG